MKLQKNNIIFSNKIKNQIDYDNEAIKKMEKNAA